MNRLRFTFVSSNGVYVCAKEKEGINWSSWKLHLAHRRKIHTFHVQNIVYYTGQCMFDWNSSSTSQIATTMNYLKKWLENYDRKKQHTRNTHIISSWTKKKELRLQQHMHAYTERDRKKRESARTKERPYTQWTKWGDEIKQWIEQRKSREESNVRHRCRQFFCFWFFCSFVVLMHSDNRK